MKYKVRLFAILKENTQMEFIELDMPKGCLGRDILQELAKRYPQIKGTIEKSVIAVNESYLLPDEKIPENAEIAIIPPVSGGMK